MTTLADIRFAETPCALCGSGDRSRIARVGTWAVPLSIVRCGACRHVYLCPAPVEADLPRLYDEDYYAGEGDYGYADDRAAPEVAALRARARLARIEEIMPPGRLLEVGCSFGAFLAEAGRRGWETLGVDLSPVAAAHCEAEGIRIVLGSLEGADLPEGGFDVVYLSETVEHLPDPRATIRAARRILSPGGLIVLGTANHASLARRLRGARWGYYMPGHLQYFTARSLSGLLEEEGFAIERRRFGDDRSLGAQQESRRLSGRRTGILAYLTDLALRIPVGSWSVGAGMLIYGRAR